MFEHAYVRMCAGVLAGVSARVCVRVRVHESEWVCLLVSVQECVCARMCVCERSLASQMIPVSSSFIQTKK